MNGIKTKKGRAGSCWGLEERENGRISTRAWWNAGSGECSAFVWPDCDMVEALSVTGLCVHMR